MSDISCCVDAYVATVGSCSRPRLQCADILLSDQPSRRAARRWISYTWRSYPGCVVAAAREHQGRWCVVATRDEGALVVRATGPSTVDKLAAELVARGRYAQWVTASTGRPDDHCQRENVEVTP